MDVDGLAESDFERIRGHLNIPLVIARAAPMRQREAVPSLYAFPGESGGQLCPSLYLESKKTMI